MIKSETTTKRIAYYLRVSTEEQAENPEGSIKNQEERLKLALRYKNANGPYGTLAGVYCDIGRSGKDMNRPELQRLIKAIEAGTVDLVMVSELSRLSRSIRDFAQMWEFMQAHGCGFMSLRESFDTSTAAGETLLFSIANFAQFERKQTSERVSANFLARAPRGLWNGGVLPLGYAPDPEQRGSLKVIDDEAKVVQTAFEAVIEHGSVSAAAQWLNREGYAYQAPLRGGGGKPRNRHFTFDSLYRLLSNPSYAGVRRIRGKDGKTQEATAVWPAIVDLGVFNKAQKVLEAGRIQKVGRQSRYPYLLSTRIVCGQCHAPLVGVSAHGKTTKVPYYGHSTQTKREQTIAGPHLRCEPFRISDKKIETRIWEEVVSLLESPGHRTPLFEALQGLARRPRTGATDPGERELAVLGNQLSVLAGRIAVLPAGVPAEPFYEEMKKLEDTRKRLASKVEATTRRGDEQAITTEAEYLALLKRLKSQLTEITPETKRRIIHSLIHQVVVTPQGFDLHFYAGSEQIKTGVRFPVISFNKKFSAASSFKSLNGGP